MRPVSVFANGPDAEAEWLRAQLRGQWRQAGRAVMVLLSLHELPAAQIAELLECHPVTVRRWIGRFNGEGLAGLADRPRCGRPRLGGRRLAGRITALLGRPGPWTLPRIRRYLGWPQLSMRTLYRRVRLVAVWRLPKLTARGDPDHDHVVAGTTARLLALPRRAVVLAEDETHLNLLPHVRPGRLRQIRSFFRARSPDEMLDTAAAWTSPWLPPGYEQNFWNAAFSTGLASVIKSAMVAFLPHLCGCAAVNDLKRTMLDTHLVDPLDDSPAGGTALPGIKVIAPFQQDLSFEFPDACRRREEIRFALRDVPRHVDTKVGDVDLSLATVRGLYDVGPDPLDYRVEAVVDRSLAKIPLDPLIEDLRHTAQLAGVDAPAPDAELVGDSLVILERLELAGELVRCR